VRKKEGGALGGFSNQGEKRGEEMGGGPAVGVLRGAGAAWGLAPTGGWCPDRCPTVAHAGTNMRAQLSAGEGVRRGRHGARGPAREGKGWAEPR
jgi:hypothetical protein